MKSQLRFIFNRGEMYYAASLIPACANLEFYCFWEICAFRQVKSAKEDIISAYKLFLNRFTQSHINLKLHRLIMNLLSLVHNPSKNK
jgi:hypothetical protein